MRRSPHSRACMKLVRLIWISAGLLAAVLLFWLILPKYMVTREVITNREVVQRELIIAFFEISGYMHKFEKSPTSIYQAVASNPNVLMPSRWASSKCAVDPWGSSYIFSIEGDHITVWSCGPNRKNENGGGDDIARQF